MTRKGRLEKKENFLNFEDQQKDPWFDGTCHHYYQKINHKQKECDCCGLIVDYKENK